VRCTPPVQQYPGPSPPSKKRFRAQKGGEKERKRMAHLKNTGLLINDDLLAVRILNGGVISFHKVIQAELNGQGGLSHSAVSENNQSVKHFPP